MNLQLPFGGLDAITDTALVVPGKLTELENVRFRRWGALIKRTGHQPLSNGVHGAGAHDAPLRTYCLEDEYLMMGARHFYSYSPAQQLWIEKGWACPFLVERAPLARVDDRSYSTPDIAIQGTVELVTWRSAWLVGATQWGAVRYILSDTGGALLAAGDIDAPFTGSAPLPSAVRTNAAGAGVLMAVYVSNLALGNIVERVFTLAAPWSLGAEVILAAGGAPVHASPLDGTAAEWLLAFAAPAAAGLTVHRYTDATTVASTNTIAAVVPVGTVLHVMGTAAEDVYVGYNLAGSHRVWSGDTTLVTNPGFPVTLDASGQAARCGFGRINATSVLAVWERASTLYWRSLSDAGVLGSLMSAAVLDMASAPFVYDSRVCVLAAYRHATNGTHYLYALTDPDGTVRTAPVLLGTMARSVGESLNFSVGPGTVPHVVQPSAGVFRIPVLIKTAFETPTEEVFVTSRIGIDRLTIDGASPLRGMSARWGGALFVAGARPSVYDGEGLYDVGFTAPLVLTTAVVSIGVTFLSVGPYQYTVVPEWPDNRGALYRGTPAPLQAEDVPAGNQWVECAWASIPPDNKAFSPRNVTGALYRTVVDGERFFFDQRAVIPIAVLYDGDVVAEGDAAVDDNEVLYTDGEILDNTGVPPCKVVVLHGERLWLGGLDDPEHVWFSKKFTTGLGPEFNEALSLRFPGERVTALGTLDTALVVFTPRSIYAVFGDGPLATGGDLGLTVQRITADVGCENQASIVLSPKGLLFASAKGIYLLGRDLSVSRAGAAVDRVLALYPQVTGAVLRADQTEVMFSVRDASGGEARMLLYDYAVDAWSLDTIGYGNSVECLSEYTGTGQTSPRLLWGAGNGRVMLESLTYLDSEGTYSMRLATPNVNLGGIAGWQALRDVMLIATRKGVHGLIVEFNYDNDDEAFATDDALSFSAADITTIGAREQLDISPPRIKFKSLRVRLTEVPPVGGNEGAVWHGLVLQGKGKARGRVPVQKEANR